MNKTTKPLAVAGELASHPNPAVRAKPVPVITGGKRVGQLRSSKVALALAVSLAGGAAAADLVWPQQHPAQRAFFCAIDAASSDQTMPRGYGAALVAELKRLERAGASTRVAMEQLRRKANCPAGAELPVYEEIDGSFEPNWQPRGA